MTLAQLQTYVSILVDDLDFGYFTQSQLTTFLNFGLKECQKKLIQAGANYNLKIVEQNTVVDQPYYTLPTDFLKLNNLITTQDATDPASPVTVISPITLNQKELYPQTGEPQNYYFLNNILVINPTPTVVTTMRLTYTYRVAELSAAGDIPDLPEVYHEYIALLATQACFLRDGRDISTLQTRLNEYEKRMREDYQQRRVDGPRMIVSTQDDMGGILY